MKDKLAYQGSNCSPNFASLLSLTTSYIPFLLLNPLIKFIDKNFTRKFHLTQTY